jgi:hypothetical protein
VSTNVEGCQWSEPAFAGIALIVTGNWLALTKIERNQK